MSELTKAQQQQLWDWYYNKNVRAIKHFLEQHPGCDLSFRDEDDENDWTLLELAAADGRPQTVAVLIAGGADVNLQDSNGYTALHFAARDNHPQTVALLLENGADLNAVDNEGWTALHWAVAEGHLEVERFLVEKNSQLIEASDTYGQTPLHMAAWNGRIDSVKFLLSKNAHINAQNNAQNNYQQTPLQLAIRNGKFETARLLVNKGADLTIRDASGKTALDHLMQYMQEHPENKKAAASLEKLIRSKMPQEEVQEESTGAGTETDTHDQKTSEEAGDDAQLLEKYKIVAGHNKTIRLVTSSSAQKVPTRDSKRREEKFASLTDEEKELVNIANQSGYNVYINGFLYMSQNPKDESQTSGSVLDVLRDIQNAPYNSNIYVSGSRESHGVSRKLSEAAGVFSKLDDNQKKAVRTLNEQGKNVTVKYNDGKGEKRFIFVAGTRNDDGTLIQSESDKGSR